MTTAVCCIAKLENHYIREWVEHYKKLGFTAVIIYDNNDKNGESFDEVISDYITSGYAIIVDYRGKVSAANSPTGDENNLQVKSYRDAYKVYGEIYDWILFVDADEFLVLETHSNINDFLYEEKFKDVNAIKFCWKYYDDNNLVRVVNDDYSLVNRFTHANTNNSFNNGQGKCILKTKEKLTINSAHCFGSPCATNIINAKCVSPNGHTENIKGPFVSERIDLRHKVAWINHYRYKTIEEYVRLKQKRLYPDQSQKQAKNLLTLTSFFNANTKTLDKVLLAHELSGITPNISKYQEIKEAGEKLKHNEQFINIINSLSSPPTSSININRLRKKYH